ncbi:MAG: PEP-CTERM sorting domain-containing protein [Thermoguttaceae bacterium]|jgi:hypothetical protein
MKYLPLVLLVGLVLALPAAARADATYSDTIYVIDSFNNVFDVANPEPDRTGHGWQGDPYAYVDVAGLNAGAPTILLEFGSLDGNGKPIGTPVTWQEGTPQLAGTWAISDAFGTINNSLASGNGNVGFITDTNSTDTVSAVQDLFGGDPATTWTYILENQPYQVGESRTDDASVNGYSLASYLPTGDTGVFWSDLDVVPEPTSLVAMFGLAGMGLVGLVWRRRKPA